MRKELFVMATLKHVDIVSKEPLASESRVIARVALNGGPKLELRVLSPGGSKERMWSYLKSVVPNVDPHERPRAFFKALPDAIDATYLMATDIHDEAHCPFRRGNASPRLR
jgi:hypothetical protein